MVIEFLGGILTISMRLNVLKIEPCFSTIMKTGRNETPKNILVKVFGE